MKRYTTTFQILFIAALIDMGALPAIASPRARSAKAQPMLKRALFSSYDLHPERRNLVEVRSKK